MSDNYYQNPIFPTAINPNSNEQNETVRPDSTYLQFDKDIDDCAISSLNEYLERNIGKTVKVYALYPNLTDFKTFNGIITEVGKDYLIINNSNNDIYYLLLTNYLNYIEFQEK